MKHKRIAIILLIAMIIVSFAGCQSGQQTSGSTQSTASTSSSTTTTSSSQNNNVSNNFDIGEVLREYATDLSFTVYSPGGEVYTQFDGALEAVHYEDPATKDQPKPLATYFMNLAFTFHAEDFRFIPSIHPDLTYPCYDHEAYYVSTVKVYDTETGFFGSPDVAIDMDGGRLVVLLESTRGEQYLLVGSADANADPAEIISFFEGFISQTWPEWWAQYNPSSGNNNVSNNFDIGEVLREYAADLSFTVYSPGGEVYTQFDGALEAIHYEDPATKDQPKPLATYFINLAFTFHTETFRFIPSVHPDLTFPCYDHEAYYISFVSAYDSHTGFLHSHHVAIDMDGGRLVVLLESTRGEQYLLVGSADANADPAEIISYFEAFISKTWPEWWEQYNAAA